MDLGWRRLEIKDRKNAITVVQRHRIEWCGCLWDGRSHSSQFPSITPVIWLLHKGGFLLDTRISSTQYRLKCCHLPIEGFNKTKQQIFCHAISRCSMHLPNWESTKSGFATILDVHLTFNAYYFSLKASFSDKKELKCSCPFEFNLSLNTTPQKSIFILI